MEKVNDEGVRKIDMIVLLRLDLGCGGQDD